MLHKQRLWSFILILVNFLLFIYINYRLMLYFSGNYALLHGKSSIFSAIIFGMAATIYMRSHYFSWDTFFYILLTLSLSWLISFTGLTPEVKVANFTGITMISIFPPISLTFYYRFSQFHKRIWLIIFIPILCLISSIDEAKYSFISFFLIIPICLLMFFSCKDDTHLAIRKKQRFITITLLCSFLPYILIDNALYLPYNWAYELTILNAKYELANYFLCLFPLVLGYYLIKNNEVNFLLKTQDYLIQLGISSVMITVLPLFAIYFLNISFGSLLLTLMSIYLIYFIVNNWQQQMLFYRYRHLPASKEYEQIERDRLSQNINYHEYLENLGELLCTLIQSAYEPLGSCLIWKQGEHYMLLYHQGSLDTFKIKKTTIFQLTSNEKIFNYHNQKLVKRELISENQTIGWLLLDAPQKDCDSKLSQQITKLLLSSSLIEQQQSQISPEYVAMYKNNLKDLTYMKKSEELRKELSYYLHDDLLQNILALKNISELSLTNNANMENTLETIVEQLDQMNKDIRNKMFDLYPSSLMDLPFEQSISILISQLKETYQGNNLPNFILQVENNIDISKDVRFTVYRMMKELINNVLKHADAQNIWIDLTNDSEQIQFSVIDDGIGFDMENTSDSGFGLLSIFQEVDSLSGKMTIKKRKPHGTRVEVFIPNTLEAKL